MSRVEGQFCGVPAIGVVLPMLAPVVVVPGWSVMLSVICPSTLTPTGKVPVGQALEPLGVDRAEGRRRSSPQRAVGEGGDYGISL